MAELETMSTGLDYLPGEPVRVVVKRRGVRYDLGDGGRAVKIAGRPRGWHELAERIVAEEGLNVARDGRVFVCANAGRDMDALAVKVAETSVRVCDALLDLEG